MYGDFFVLLTVGSTAQVLRSFGKLWEAKLLTYTLIINKNTADCAEIKNCALERDCAVCLLVPGTKHPSTPPLIHDVTDPPT